MKPGPSAHSSLARMFPIRCYTCNTVIANLHPRYRDLTMNGHPPSDVFDTLDIRRMCCRRMFLSYMDLTKTQAEYGNIDSWILKDRIELKRKSKTVCRVSCG